MWRTLYLLLAVIMGFSSRAWAREASNQFLEAPNGASPSEVAAMLKTCKDAVREDVIAMCAWDRYRREEMAYRLAAKDVSLALSEQSERDALTKANHAFEQFRDATCNFDSMRNGRMGDSLLYGCLELYTRRRAVALSAFAKCEKTGDCEMPNLLYVDENKATSRANQK